MVTKDKHFMVKFSVKFRITLVISFKLLHKKKINKKKFIWFCFYLKHNMQIFFLKLDILRHS